MKKILLSSVLALTVGCAGVNNFTKETMAEACSHSKEHRDITVLGLTDNATEPNSPHIHCACEYGFPYNDAESRCMTKKEVKALRAATEAEAAE